MKEKGKMPVQGEMAVANGRKRVAGGYYAATPQTAAAEIDAGAGYELLSTEKKSVAEVLKWIRTEKILKPFTVIRVLGHYVSEEKKTVVVKKV